MNEADTQRLNESWVAAAEGFREAAAALIKAVEETVSVLWETLKEFLDSNPELRELFSLYLRTDKSENQSSFRLLFRDIPTVKEYQDQFTYRPVPRLARSRC